MTNKTKKNLDLAKNKKLIERQRNLWAHAEAIELAQKRGDAIPVEVSEWLHRALKNIACGEDANEVFNVIPEKRGVRKDGFLREMQKKITNAYIAASTETTDSGVRQKKTALAIKEISQALPATKKSTVRKNWNKVSTERKPRFTIGKK